jgi:cytochrome c oxidase subunit 4
MEPKVEHPVVGYGTFIGVWVALLALTASLVGVSALHLGNWGILAVLFITPLKAALVLYYFMHLKYEDTTLKLMVFVAVAALVIFLGLLMLDYSFR